jgi:hypothetical protein
MKTLFVSTFVFLAAAAGYLTGCSPVDCELNPDQPECRGEDYEDESELDPTDIARGQVHGDKPIASIEQSLVGFQPPYRLPSDLWFMPSVVPASADWKLHQTMTRFMYKQAQGQTMAVYVWENATPTTVFGRLMPVGTHCYNPPYPNSIGTMCKVPGGAYRTYTCPSVRLSVPLAYSPIRDGARLYNFNDRFEVIAWPSLSVSSVYLGVGKHPDGRSAVTIMCRVPMTSKMVTVRRRY